ncbi:MAG TPA: hypothetical protein PL029_07030 [Bacteroidia bacterium]|nr:hypothetical protein [Bacteroidia bacterium]
MRIIKSLLALALFALCTPLAAQTPAFDELEFELDSVSTVYKPTSKNFVLIRSKRGTSGVNKTPAGDAITSAEVTEIVLVFSETDPADIAEREEANQERWENLLRTYPEFFQFSTTYKSLCQCKNGGDAEAFKSGQGFYVYINGDVPKIAAETPKVEETKPTPPKTETKTETPKAAENQPAAKAGKTEEKKIAEEPKPAVTDKTAVKTPDAPAIKENKQEAAKENNTAKNEEKSNTAAAETPKAKPVKKAGVAKSRKAKDPRACRMACYENGVESLDAFLKDNIKLSKKERRKAKKLTPVAKLQLNVDGSIKKVLVTCPDEKLNLMITEAFKSMNPWNATVKSGVTVKSEVKVTLKFDKKAKSFKAFEVSVTPRLAIKCKCVSDSELFD